MKVKIKTKNRKNKSYTKVKSGKKSYELLDIIEICWECPDLPLGNLLDDRYYVLENLENRILWLCWDLQEKREVTVKAKGKPQRSETNLELNLENVNINLPDLSQENCNATVEAIENPPNSQLNVELDKCLAQDNLLDLQQNHKAASEPIEIPQSTETNSEIFECLQKLNLNLGELLQERYYVLALLCNGQMSTVLLCWDLQMKRDVVIKIPKEHKDNVDMVANEIKMLREAHAWHPTDPRLHRIIQIFEDFNIPCAERNIPCAVLETLEGTLLDLVENSKHHSLPLAIVKNITRQLLEGLDYLHYCKMIHTDIKPENVLYSNGKHSLEDVRIKIADLGNACYEHNHISWEIQTPAYRSLEAILDAGYDISADIWSAACVIYELATGDYLFGIRPCDFAFRDVLHIAAIIEHLRPIPRHIIMRGRKSSKIFDEYGQLRYMDNVHCNSIQNVLLNTYCWSLADAGDFATFLEYMLELDPDKRPTAAECLQHPWLN